MASAVAWPQSNWKYVANHEKYVEKQMPQTTDKLMRFMVEEWDAIPQEIVNNLVSSMQSRCEAVLLHDGNRILY